MKPRQNGRGFLFPGLDLAELVSAARLCEALRRSGRRRAVAGKVFLSSSRYLTPKKEKDMGQAISKLTIKGYKSIRNLENFELRNLNILIGPNGGGKSNFVGFFEFIKEIAASGMQLFIERNGGAFTHLYLGPKVTEQLYADLQFGDNAYQFTLIPTLDDRLIFQDEKIRCYDPTKPIDCSLGRAHNESLLKDQLPYRNRNYIIVRDIYPAISHWVVYHFHDTSGLAKVKSPCLKQEYEHLRPDAGNLAAFLLRLKSNNPKEYDFIKETVQLAAPFFEDFILKNHHSDPNKTLLEWKQKGSDYPFQPSQMSDGTLRFICLATALLQPNPPSTILLDEPELGLHPYALTLLAGLIQKASKRTQVIVSTQSAALIDHFEPEDIVVIERQNGESIFKRLNKADLKVWLEDYSLGELWQKNVFGGRPARE
jgi:predicted ATPase